VTAAGETNGIVVRLTAATTAGGSPEAAAPAVEATDPAPSQRTSGPEAVLAISDAATNFIASLPNGIRVELVGISDNPSIDRPWWRPDGSPLPERPYPGINAFSTEEGKLAREFAVWLHGAPSGQVGVVWRVIPASSTASCTLPETNTIPPDLYIAHAMIAPTTTTVTVRVGIAAGPWETVGRGNALGGGGSTVGPGNALGGGGSADPVQWVFSPATEQDGQVSLAVSHTIEDQNMQVVAIGTDGREHVMRVHSGSGSKGLHQLTVTLAGTKLADIQAIHLRRRPYQWAEFRDVAMQPGGAAPTP